MYLYAKNLNAWANKVLGMDRCVGYDKEIEAFYGKLAVGEFAFQDIDYDEIRSRIEKNQPLITHFFEH